MADPRFPLGTPINRPVLPTWIPIPGRPGWMRHRVSGREVYVEAQKPAPWPFPIAK